MKEAKKIMLVDDEPISNFIMRKMIAIVAPQTEIYDFTDPVKAFSEIPLLNPDLIFLDLNMPELDGWSFLEKMKEEGLSNNVHVLTSSTSEVDRTRSSDYDNIKRFLIKPISLTELEDIL